MDRKKLLRRIKADTGSYRSLFRLMEACFFLPLLLILYFFKAPIYILIIPLILLYFFALGDILSHIRIWQRRLNEKSVRPAPTWWYGFKKAAATLRWGNWGYFASGLSFILLCNLGPLLFFLISMVTSLIPGIPRYFLIPLCIAVIIIFLSGVMHQFVLLEWMIHPSTYKRTALKSSYITGRAFPEHVIRFLVAGLKYGAVYFSIVILSAFLCVLFKVMDFQTLFITPAFYYLCFLLYVVTFTLSSEETIFRISRYYFNNRDELEWNAAKKKESYYMPVLEGAFVISLAACVGVNAWQMRPVEEPYVEPAKIAQGSIKIQNTTWPMMTGHRGFSAQYPENTMASIQAAVEAGVDWVEFDIQESADHVLFLCHDGNMGGIAGVDKNSWDMTWDEISRLHVLSSSEPFVKLEDVLAYLEKTDVKLNVELKPDEHQSPDYEKNVLNMIDSYDLKGRYVIASQNYECLEKVKSIDSKRPTLFVTDLIRSPLEDLSAADNFSIAISGINQDVVDEVHAAGKTIDGWTVDSRQEIEYLLDLGVDNIITNNVSYTKDIIYEYVANQQIDKLKNTLSSFNEAVSACEEIYSQT